MQVHTALATKQREKIKMKMRQKGKEAIHIQMLIFNAAVTITTYISVFKWKRKWTIHFAEEFFHVFFFLHKIVCHSSNRRQWRKFICPDEITFWINNQIISFDSNKTFWFQFSKVFWCVKTDEQFLFVNQRKLNLYSLIYR